jgi:RNA polymerase sigma factor (sigma-70 family)
MVFAISLKILGNAHDARDAFQATFLILATRANSIMRRGSAAIWIHGVALRVARRARSDGARRKAHEKQIADKAQSEIEPGTKETGNDFEMLHDEVERLPRKYREAVVLCYLERLSLEAAITCPQARAA